MSRYIGPKSKIARRFGEAIFGPDKVLDRRPTPPGQHGARRRRKLSEYGEQLLAKQKAKFIYGMRERQFRLFFKRALAKEGKTGDLLLQMCESRLDNVVYRLGIAPTRAAARQLVTHRHIVVAREGSPDGGHHELARASRRHRLVVDVGRVHVDGDVCAGSRALGDSREHRRAGHRRTLLALMREFRCFVNLKGGTYAHPFEPF